VLSRGERAHDERDPGRRQHDLDAGTCFVRWSVNHDGEASCSGMLR
jgi:hypothetical protein